jgi:hypothetical protein
VALRDRQEPPDDDVRVVRVPRRPRGPHPPLLDRPAAVPGKSSQRQRLRLQCRARVAPHPTPVGCVLVPTSRSS